MNKYSDIYKKLKIEDIIESKEEERLYETVLDDIIEYVKNNNRATFQNIITYVNGSDRRTLRLLDQLVRGGVLQYEYPFFSMADGQAASSITPDNVRCRVCDSKMIDTTGSLLHVARVMEEIFKHKVPPTFLFDQRPVNYQTSVRRAGYMILRGDLQRKKVAVIGDDDLTSIALALTGLADEIVVFEIDKRLVRYLFDVIQKYNLKNISVVECDLTQEAPKKYYGYFDMFTTDPTPTSKPFTLFINLGLQLLKKEKRSVGYTSIYPSCKEKDISIQKILTDMNAMITDLVPYFTQYDYIEHTYSEHDKELARQYASDEPRISFFEYLLRFETIENTAPLDVHYDARDIIGTATQRVLKNPTSDPAWSDSDNLDASYLKEILKNLKKKIK